MASDKGLLDVIADFIPGGSLVKAQRKALEDGTRGAVARQESTPDSNGLTAKQEAARKAKAKARKAQVKRGPTPAEIAAIRAKRNAK